MSAAILQLAVSFLLVASDVAAGDAPPARVLSLDQALTIAAAHQPQLMQARASTLAAKARADGAFAPMLPLVSATASYARETANTPIPTPKPSNDSYDAWNVGANASLVVFDFGRTFTNWTAARTDAEARAFDEKSEALAVAYEVRSAFFAARAQASLVDVAREALANEERHLARVAAYVDVGARPRIDLAQANGARANAFVQLVNAENNFAVARARLFQAMGVIGDEGERDVAIAGDAFATVSGEDASLDDLVDEARRARPDIAAVEKLLRAQELSLASTMASYAPVLAVGAAATDVGQSLDALTWNWSAQATLSWSLFSGGATLAQRDRSATPG